MKHRTRRFRTPTILPFPTVLLAHAVPHSLADLLELRKLRKTRQGIESSKLIVGDAKKRRRRGDEDDQAEQELGGLRAGAGTPGTPAVEDDDP
jgi:hypothetical protein